MSQKLSFARDFSWIWLRCEFEHPLWEKSATSPIFRYNMVTYKLILRKDKTNKEGLHPVFMRVTINRKSKQKSTKVYINAADWNPETQNVRATVENYNSLRLFFKKQKSDMQNRILDMEIRDVIPTFQNIWTDIADEFNDYGGDMIAFIAAELANPRPKPTIGTYNGWKSKFNTLKAYVPKINMHITKRDFLEQYQEYLTKDVKDINSYSTVYSHLKFLRKMWNLAIKRGITTNYPFSDFTMSTPKYGNKVFLNKEERARLMALLDHESMPGYLMNTLVHFLIACYSGLRYSDWDKCTNVVDGVLAIKQNKKKGDLLLIPISKPLQMLINRRLEHWRVFTDQRYRVYLKELSDMAKINKHITTHTGRHTFAMMCLNEAEMTFEMVAALLDDKVETVKNHYARYHTTSKKLAISKLDNL